MSIKKLFYKPIDRNIEGVIKADDDENIFNEVDEYVITNEISKRLDIFLDAYLNYSGANGVWISGFFGSGKSHLLKILSYVLENKALLGDKDMPVADLFLPKLDEDVMLKANMQKAVKISSKSILFNIDQKADVISKDQSDAVLSVFMKVFNEMQGYYSKHGYLADFERDLDNQGLYDKFKNKYGEISGSTWVEDRDIILLENENFAQALSAIKNVSYQDALKVIDKYEENYTLSIEDFAGYVKDYIDKQPKGFRLNFFVDEVGQYIANNTKLMTNLQTIAETLATKCKGKAWVLVTSQEDMENVIGQLDKAQGNDFSKIQDRFKIRMKLTSANVAEVIQKRLLKKKKEFYNDLHSLYDVEKNNFKTLFQFGDGCITFKGFEDNKHFASAYPFLPYQFELFQSSIIGLSNHNAFEGKHRSIGERSMLGVFQDVVKKISDKELGEIATFDLMFEGIRSALVTQIQSDIRLAENNIEDDFSIKVLKSLFLIKFIKQFKATPKNIGILLIDKFEMDISAHQKRIQEALNKLEYETYIQRRGDIYEFLTDDEKDIESEIKNTEIDASDINDFIVDLVFRTLLGDNKIRYEENKHDFPYARKIDSNLIGQDKELAVNFITPFNENYNNRHILVSQSLGKSEMLVIIPEDSKLEIDLRLYKQTEKYCKNNHSTNLADNIRKILVEKGIQNNTRKQELILRLKDLISNATIIVNGNELDVQSTDPKTRIINACQTLITTTYTNINMLKFSYKENMIKSIISDKSDDLFSSDETMSEAESEVLTVILRNKNLGERSTVKSLLDKFSGKPYGWYQSAILCIISRLYSKSKVEIKQDSNILSESQIISNLASNRMYSNTIIEPQEEFTEREVRKLKDFHQEFFNEPNMGKEARECALLFKEKIEDELDLLETLLHQKVNYPFLAKLESVCDELKKFTNKEYNFYLKELLKFEDELLDYKEDNDLIKNFMHGSQKDIFDEISNYIQAEKVDFEYYDTDELQKLLAIKQGQTPYSGNKMKKAKELLNTIKNNLKTQLKTEQEKAINSINQSEERLKTFDDFSKIEELQQNTLIVKFTDIKTDINNSNFIPVIREKVNSFLSNRYNQIIHELTVLATPPKEDKTGEIEDAYAVEKEDVSFKSISVSYGKTHLDTKDDLEEYIKALKEAYIETIKEDKRINLY